MGWGRVSVPMQLTVLKQLSSWQKLPGLARTCVDEFAQGLTYLQTAELVRLHEALQHISPIPASHCSSPSTLLLPQNVLTFSESKSQTATPYNARQARLRQLTDSDTKIYERNKHSNYSTTDD